ncbi:ABC transporter permease [Alteribacillus iranensis]|uniref:Putative ABC transport system permease protein n=1 Tax=Alteribacillus iranensis TaxID=930128 RepID=A0A1I2DKF7_9BACI|nr:iron export ABC transporter permease subunit FetB [Alteribacillus iranensis]SFE81044.1 putative ABC transport system permease protein [Alteribacillus iranensis]
MEDNMIDLTLWQLLSAYIFIIVLLVIVKVRKIPRDKEILISTLRMTIQLLLVGYVLMYLFENPHPLLTIAVVILMVVFAVWNIFKRIKHDLNRRMKRIIAISMAAGTLSSLIYFNFVVIQFSPWYDPRYFIPIAGMIIGNSMTGITLGVQTLVEGLTEQRSKVEAALMLGATPKEATRKLVNQSFDAAILPTINSMVGTGIVFLPGMMTGQILAGVNPITAIEYQIAVLLGIAGAVSLTVIIYVQNGYKVFFNEKSQLEE